LLFSSRSIPPILVKRLSETQTTVNVFVAFLPSLIILDFLFEEVNRSHYQLVKLLGEISDRGFRENAYRQPIDNCKGNEVDIDAFDD
jgi:hypothetical protein